MDRRTQLVLASALIVGACGSDDAPTPTPTPVATQTPSPAPTASPITLTQFGFAAVACDHDDPFDTDTKTDYSDEVATFSNLNQVCPTGDVAIDRDRLTATGRLFDPLLLIEGVFFDPSTSSLRSDAQANALWTGLQQSITESGIDPGRIVFYLFDEPTLRGVDLAVLEGVATQVKQAYPNSKLMLIEAYDASRQPVVPAFVDLWGFNAYTLRDPAADTRYTGVLDTASAQLRNGQALVLIADGIHTPFHRDAGLTETDMAEVASNYFALAQSRDDVAAMLVYTWAGGIDSNDERGVRDLPANVQDGWVSIGREITAK